MTSIGELLDHLDETAADLTLTQPTGDEGVRVAAGWPSLALAAGRALLRVPTFEPPDAAGLYRALATLAEDHASTPPGHALDALTRDYERIDALLTGQPAAIGREVLHAQALRGRLLTPLNTLAEWTAYYAGPALAPDTRAALIDVAAGSRYSGRPTGSRYTDLGDLTDAPRDPVLRGIAAWASAASDSLTPAHVTTAGLRATLNDLTVATSTAYYLTKASLFTRHLHPVIATPALDALWEARNEWRIQMVAFPTDLRLGPLISEERNAVAGDLRETLRWAFQTTGGEWLAPTELYGRHPDRVLGYARALMTASADVADHYATARGVLATLPVRRRDPNYHPVFPVGTDLSKVRRERWLPVASNDQQLRVEAARARLAATQAARAVDLVNETALGRPRTPSETVETVPVAMLLRTIELLDAMIPPPHHKFGTIAHPGSRPAWANHRTPPQSIPDQIRDADPPSRSGTGQSLHADPAASVHAATRWETAAPLASTLDASSLSADRTGRGVPR